MKPFITFLLASAAHFFLAPLFPSLHLFAYAPFLVLFLIHSTLLRSLGAALGVGLLLDFTSSAPMGIHALNCFFTSFFLYRYRKHFFKDNPYNLPLFTSFFSFTSTILYALLFFLFDRRVLFHGRWVLADLLFMSLIDGLYAAAAFTLPFRLFETYQAKIRMKHTE